MTQNHVIVFCFTLINFSGGDIPVDKKCDFSNFLWVKASFIESHLLFSFPFIPFHFAFISFHFAFMSFHFHILLSFLLSFSYRFGGLCRLPSSGFMNMYMYKLIIAFSRMRSKGSRFTLGVWGLRVCSLDVAFTVATVRNRPQPFATVRAIPVWPCLWEVLQRWSFLEVSDVSLLCFAWQAWHFVTFRRVVQRVENRFAWQAQYFCDVFRRCVAVFVAGAALWTCPSSFFVAGAAL